MSMQKQEPWSVRVFHRLEPDGMKMLACFISNPLLGLEICALWNYMRLFDYRVL